MAVTVPRSKNTRAITPRTRPLTTANGRLRPPPWASDWSSGTRGGRNPAPERALGGCRGAGGTGRPVGGTGRPALDAGASGTGRSSGGGAEPVVDPALGTG